MWHLEQRVGFLERALMFVLFPSLPALQGLVPGFEGLRGSFCFSAAFLTRPQFCFCTGLERLSLSGSHHTPTPSRVLHLFLSRDRAIFWDY